MADRTTFYPWLEDVLTDLLTRITQHHQCAKKLCKIGGETVKKKLSKFLSAIHRCKETLDFDDGCLAADEFYEALNDCRCKLESLLTAPESGTSEYLQVHDAHYIAPLLFALFDLDVIAGLLIVEFCDGGYNQGVDASNKDTDEIPVKDDSTQGDTETVESVTGIKLLLKTGYRPVATAINRNIDTFLQQKRRPSDFANETRFILQEIVNRWGISDITNGTHYILQQLRMSIGSDITSETRYILQEIVNPLRILIGSNAAKKLIGQGIQVSWLTDSRNILNLVCKLNAFTNQCIEMSTYPQSPMKVVIPYPAPHYPWQSPIAMIERLRNVLPMSSGNDDGDKSAVSQHKKLLMKKHEETIKW